MAQTPTIDFVNTLLPLIIIVFVIAIGVILLYSHFRKNLYTQMLAHEELKGKHQGELLRSSIEAQEEERKRIARDLHDELGATLSISRMHLVQMEDMLTNESHGRKLANVRVLTETALATMRRISHELMPPQLETLGLIKTLEDVAAQLNQLEKMTLKLEAQSYFPDMPWRITLGMYRVIMELINNTLRHAHASEISLTIGADVNEYTFKYCDNGIGLPAEALPKGLGWNNIEARINSLQGNYVLEKGHHGFEIFIRIPSS